MTKQVVDEALEVAADLQSLIDEVGLTKSTVGSTSVQRKAAVQAAIDNPTDEEWESWVEKMNRTVDAIVANTIDMEHLSTLTHDELQDLMIEFLDQRDVKELVEVRYKMIRAAVFAHITELHKLKGTLNPDYAPGEAPVSELGKKFVKQRQGKSKLDDDQLAELLGPERWEQVRKAVVVPAVPERVEYHLDHDAMMKLVLEDPTAMEALRACVTPGGLSFHVRDISE